MGLRQLRSGWRQNHGNQRLLAPLIDNAPVQARYFFQQIIQGVAWCHSKASLGGKGHRAWRVGRNVRVSGSIECGWC